MQGDGRSPLHNHTQNQSHILSLPGHKHNPNLARPLPPRSPRRSSSSPTTYRDQGPEGSRPSRRRFRSRSFLSLERGSWHQKPCPLTAQGLVRLLLPVRRGHRRTTHPRPKVSKWSATARRNESKKRRSYRSPDRSQLDDLFLCQVNGQREGSQVDRNLEDHAQVLGDPRRRKG